MEIAHLAQMTIQLVKYMKEMFSDMGQFAAKGNKS